MDEEELLSKIAKIPGDEGWWHSHNGDTYVALAKQLTEQGMSGEDAYELLSSAYGAAADEFGN